MLLCQYRIEKKLDENLSETHYGFVAKKDTRGAISLLKVVIQRALNASTDIIAYFIDYMRKRSIECIINCILKYSDNEELILEPKRKYKARRGMFE